ncbi:MAG TPA: thioredoxin domain-containing protein, partial [Mycobacterium sp.]
GGKGREYHSTVYANQPTEGEGFSDETLISFASQAGILGGELDTFTSCFQEATYLPWAANSYKAFQDAGVGGTPTGYLNGVELNSSDLADIEGLKQKIAAATAN